MRGHRLVGVGIFRVFAFKKAFTFMLTPAWALVLAFAAERMRKAILNLFCRRHNRLYGWLPVDDWYDVGGLWILSLCLNSYLLELGAMMERSRLEGAVVCTSYKCFSGGKFCACLCAALRHT